MAKILVAGDWHGHIWHPRAVIPMAHERGVSRIIHTGDFGWWPHVSDSSAYAGQVNDMLKRRDMELAWIDGNHENFDDLKSRPYELDSNGMRMYVRPNGHKLLEHVKYIPRGLPFDIGGKHAVGFGGAASVDKMYRTEGHSWWRQELPTGREVNDALDNAHPVSYMFTHDAPARPPGLPGGWKEDPASDNNRAAIRALMEAYNPQVLYHGHYHLPYETQIPHEGGITRVVGLGADQNLDGGNHNHSLVLDTETGQHEYLPMF